MVSEKSFILLVVSSTTPFFAVLAIMFGLDCLRIYAFIVFNPLTRFRKWKFPNFGREKGDPPLQRDFQQDFRFFSLENPSFGM